MKKFLVVTLTLAISLHAIAQKERNTLDRIVATVGDKIIMLSEVQDQVNYIASKNEGVTATDAGCYVMEQFLMQKLLLVEAERDSVEVKDEEVDVQLDSRINEILQYMGGSIEQFKEFYGMSPIEMKEKMRDDQKEQLLQERKREQILEGVSITPAEVSSFYAKIPKDSLPYFNSEVEVSVIVIKPKVNPEEDKRAKTLAESIRARLMAGENFEELAKTYSADPGSGSQGGSLGCVDRGSFVQAFEAAAYRLKPGEVSQPVKTDFGYHIIKLKERLGNRICCSHILIKPELTEDDSQKALSRLDSVRTLIIKDSISFSQAVKLYTEDETSKNYGGSLQNPKTGEAYFELSDLEPDIYFTIDSMKIGNVSEPMLYVNERGEQAYRIFKLTSRSDPHTANLHDDYSKIQAAALEEKKAHEIAKWLSTRLKNSYIQIADEMKICPNLERWYKKP